MMEVHPKLSEEEKEALKQEIIEEILERNRCQHCGVDLDQPNPWCGGHPRS